MGPALKVVGEADSTAGAAEAFLDAADVVASARGPLGAYIHVPFCGQICPFCPYNKVIHQPARVTPYFESLQREIERVTSHMTTSFTSLYIGGGTPTLCIDQLRRVIPMLKVDNEIAIECLPTHATPERLDALVDMGISSMSLGVQSFSDDVLRHLKRPTTAADNIAGLAASRDRMALLDVDLMFDVAYENERTFLDDVERCFDAGVDQISTYPVMRFGYTPFGKGSHLAHREHQALAKAAAMAETKGYERRSVWTFNRKGTPNYTSITRPFYVGFGAGAASYTGGLFSVNAFNLHHYEAMLAPDDDRLPARRAFSFSPLVSSAYAMFWQTYTGRVDLRWVYAHFGRQAYALWRRIARMLVRAGVLAAVADDDDDVFRLTPSGYDRYHDLERWVTYHFIEPLWKEMMAEHEAGSGAGWVRRSHHEHLDPVWAIARRFLHERT